MTEDKATLTVPFSCHRVTVYFIYSFVPAFKNGKAVYPPDLPKARGTEHMGTPSSRESIVPHLSLRADSAWFESSKRSGTVAGREFSFGSLIRIFPSGATCCLTLDVTGKPTQKLSTVDILKLLNLTSQRPGASTVAPEPMYLEGEGSGRKSLYDRFEELVTNLCTEHSLDRLDVKYDLIEPGREGQSPWLVTVAAVDGEIAEAFCGHGDAADDPARTKMIKIRRYEPSIAPILFRSVADQLFLEPAYVEPPTPVGIPGLFSVNLDARLFVCMSRRSILCVCENSDVDPASYFVPGLLDVCEMVRARWHSLVTLNKLIDLTIRQMVDPKKIKLFMQSKVLSLRQMLATGLEDPTVYIIAGDALSKLYLKLREIFRLDELKSTLIEKMDLMDRVYRDALQLSWLSGQEPEE